MKSRTSNLGIELWDQSLTKKLRYLKTLAPIFQNTRTVMRDPTLRAQIKHYDPIAITLKIFEVIIDKMSEFDGVTRGELIDAIIPLLKRMDEKEGVTNLTRRDHQKFLNRLLKELIQEKGRRGHYIQYTDYSQNPPEQMKHAFRLITPRSIDGTRTFLEAESEAINIFLQLLMINLEDTQKANLVILERQMKRGDLDNAIDSVRLNYRLTKQYYRNLNKMITRVKRNLVEVDFNTEFEAILSEAELHIREILKLHSVRSKEINYRIDKLGIDVPSEEIFKLNELQVLLHKSSELFLPLQTRIRNARHIYLKEQWPQVLLRKKSRRPDFEGEIFPAILKSSYRDFQPLFDELLTFYIRPRKSKILAFDQLLELILQRNKIEVKPRPKEKPEVTFVDDLIDLVVFSDDLIAEANGFLVTKLAEHNHSLDFNTLILEALQESKSTLFCNYLRLLVQIQVSIYDTDQDLHLYDFTVDVLPSEFSNPLFIGSNYQITTRSISQ